MTEGNLNLTYNDYLTKVFKSYNAAFPVKLRSSNAKQPAPWMTPRLRQCIRKKSKFYKLYLKGRIANDEYIFFRNRLTAAIRRVRSYITLNCYIMHPVTRKRF